MKLFETPVVEVIKFSVQDIITVSNEEPDMPMDYPEPCIS